SRRARGERSCHRRNEGKRAVSKKKVILIGAGVLVLAVMAVANIASQKRHRTEVQVTSVATHDVAKGITASGGIQPKKPVNVSAGAIGKVTRLAVKEGDHVNKGDFLLEIDATNYEASVKELEAAVRGAEASVDLENAALQKAKDDYQRAQQLAEK